MDGMLSQDEINALLSGVSGDGADKAETPPTEPAGETPLTDMEKDAIGEVANISMGTSATTLYSLVNTKVNITTPVVELATWDNILENYERPCVFIKIEYKIGLDGVNILILKEEDVKIITDLMMGGDGTNTDSELGELHLSAISEAMNQMMGSSATSLSSMLGTTIDISPPTASLIDLGGDVTGADVSPFLTESFVKITFSLQIGDLVDSKIMQLYPLDFAKKLYDHFVGAQGAPIASTPVEEEPAPQPQPAAQPTQPDMGMPQMNAQPDMGMPQMNMQPDMGMQQMNMQPQMNMGMPQMNMGMPQMNMGMPQMYMQPQMGMQPMNIQPAQFQSFAPTGGTVGGPENIEIIRDVPLEVTVELGRTIKSISDILEFAPGTIIELDKIAGEPIDVLVNGKFVAKGEVVVIEENFGVRVTEIIK